MYVELRDYGLKKFILRKEKKKKGRKKEI